MEHLKGVGVGVGEASEKYGVGFSTIFRWYQKGLIGEIERVTVQGREKILLDECDVADGRKVTLKPRMRLRVSGRLATWVYVETLREWLNQARQAKFIQSFEYPDCLT